MNLRIFMIGFFCTLFTFLQPVNLEAGGWGQREDVCEHEGILWNGVFFDMNGIHLSAYLPNYSGTQLQNGIVSLEGNINDTIGYVIITSFNPGFSPPKSLEAFMKLIQDANPTALINPVDAQKFGAKYAIDLIPANPKESSFWRFIATKDRLIKMGSDDINENQRIYFFDSLYIH